MPRTMTVGERVREKRSARGWSQADLAARMGVTRARISAVERGADPRPQLEWLARVAAVLEVSPSEFDPRLAGRSD